MCNRFRQVKVREDLSLLFRARPLETALAAAQDLFPKRCALVVRHEAGERVLDGMNWGVPLAVTVEELGLQGGAGAAMEAARPNDWERS